MMFVSIFIAKNHMQIQNSYNISCNVYLCHATKSINCKYAYTIKHTMAGLMI